MPFRSQIKRSDGSFRLISDAPQNPGSIGVGRRLSLTIRCRHTQLVLIYDPNIREDLQITEVLSLGITYPFL